jgi:hypothetical protein
MRSGHAARWSICRFLLFCSAGAIWSFASTGFGAVVQGTLCTSVGDSISSDQLNAWINEFIPAGNQRLLVMTQCFGGNAATSFAGAPNTSVISATSPGQTAKYGGYDNDAAGALKPMPGTTANNVHTAGTTGKHATETPTNGGTVAPGGISLEPVATPADMIESRHVLVYAGQPGGGGGTTDVMQRDTIKMNFMGDASVVSVGGAGGGGWDKPGSAKGLREALKEIGMAIAMSPNPTKEQFIMYITDHGDLHNKETTATPSQPTLTVPLVPSFPTFSLSQLNPTILADDPFNQPGFSVFLELPSPVSESIWSGSGRLFNPGDLLLQLDNPSLSAPDFLNIPSFFDVFVELDGSGIVGDYPGEGVRVMYELPFPDNSMAFADSFFDVFYSVSLTNNTGGTYFVHEFSQDSGNIIKPVPEPSAMMLAVAALIGLGFVRTRRK